MIYYGLLECLSVCAVFKAEVNVTCESIFVDFDVQYSETGCLPTARAALRYCMLGCLTYVSDYVSRLAANGCPSDDDRSAELSQQTDVCSEW